MMSAKNREEWLLNAVDALTPFFIEKGYCVPDIRVSCGFPSSGTRSLHNAECWNRQISEDNVNEIFIHPKLDDPLTILDTLAHEMVHAIDDCKHGHGKEFQKIALDIGLEGEMRSARAGAKLTKELKRIATELGPYPHKKLKIASKPRLHKPGPKAKCSECGYEITPLKKWMYLGPPMCPIHKIPMQTVGEWDDEF